MKLIVLEGIDGAGTTTQALRLEAALRADGRDVHRTREPSDGPIGRLLREMLAGKHAPVDATTLSLLFAADRADHLGREVEPALARGTVVISDRWYHSSLAYQGAGEERAWIRTLNARARHPDLTLLLDIDAEVGARRRSDAGRPTSSSMSSSCSAASRPTTARSPPSCPPPASASRSSTAGATSTPSRATCWRTCARCSRWVSA
jgi:dTMP kinase